MWRNLAMMDIKSIKYQILGFVVEVGNRSGTALHI